MRGRFPEETVVSKKNPAAETGRYLTVRNYFSIFARCPRAVPQAFGNGECTRYPDSLTICPRNNYRLIEDGDAPKDERQAHSKGRDNVV
jgi:hypothetical protein